VVILTLVFYLLVSCALLAWGADRLVIGASAAARHFKLPALVIGVVLVGFFTSFPEILVSLLASLKQRPDLALGNALGSYITNISLVLGVSALVIPLPIHSRLLKCEYPIMFLALLIVWLLLLDGYLSQADGIIMLLSFLGIIALMAYFAWCKRQSDDAWVKEFEHSTAQVSMSLLKSLLFVLFGFVVLYLGSELLIFSAVGIAKRLGVSELIIGLTVVAVGTSLPELAASVAGALRKEPDIALGNVIGSNIFGLLAVTAMPGLFSPGKINTALLWREFPVMAFVTVLLFLLK